MFFENQIRKIIRSNRRSGVASRAARLAERYLNAWHVTGFYEFASNGERYMLETIKRAAPDRFKVVWDVGAHEGEYADAVHDILPAAEVVSFEIIPAIAEKLRNRHRDATWFELKQAGLSDSVGKVDVAWNKRYHTTSTIHPGKNAMFEHDEIDHVSCDVTTIDTLIAAGQKRPDILKIDVEGHEAAVLDGASALLQSEDAPAIIQFEYGVTWIPASRTLYQVQRKLEAAGYKVGRLYPDHVVFKPYDYTSEHYRMGNMIAARDADLVKALS